MKRLKYGNSKTYDGFDSKKEARRYQELLIMERAGKISDLKRQVKFVLIPVQREYSREIYTKGRKKGCFKPGKILERECAYYADFTYHTDDGRFVVEDSKGMRTKDYIIKRKLMLREYGIRIYET